MMNMMMTYLRSYVKNEEGQGMAEYGLILAAVAVVVFAAIGLMGDQLVLFFGDLTTKLTVAE